jgi:replicative DNA helicase
MVKQLIEHQVPTLWLSFEMSAPELMWRLAVQSLDRPDITIQKAKTKSLDEEQEAKFKQMLEYLRLAPLTIIDSMSTWEEARMMVLYAAYTMGIKAVFVDYIQNIVVEGGGRMSTEFDSLSTIVRDLQRLSVSRDFFACAVSQVNRDSVKNDNDRVFGYRGSSSIENASDVGLIFKKVGKLPDDPRRFLVVGKNRSGNTGKIQIRTDFNYGGISEVTGEIWVEDE